MQYSAFGRRSLVLITACSILMGVGVPTAFSQSETLRQFSIKAGELAAEASLSISQDDQSEAITLLDRALALPGLSEFETSSLLHMRGSAYYSLDDFEGAIRSFEAAISANGLLPDEGDKLNLVIGQLMIGQGQYKRGAMRLEAAVDKTGNRDPKIWGMLAQGWAQSGNHEKALQWAKKWTSAAAKMERKHFDFLNYLYHSLGRSDEQLKIVGQMIDHWPEDEELWRAYVSLLSNTGQELEAFNANKVMYKKGLLTGETDILRLVQYYSYFGIPFEAAQILEREMENGRVTDRAEHRVMLADYYRHAREYGRAIPALEAAAKSGISENTEVYPSLLEAYVSQGRCDDARDIIGKAGEARYDTGKAWMLVGTCIYERGQNEERPSCEHSDAERAQLPIEQARRDAVTAFSYAPAGSPHRNSAQKWIAFIQSERRAEAERCEIEEAIIEERCRLWYKRARQTAVVTGKPIPENLECAPFIPEFDKTEKAQKSPS